MDGEITFHNWHPVNIQEYGIAAPDPRDPDMVYGSQRNNVSLYNRKTGQTTLVGPDLSARGPKGEAYNRNVRTMPIAWSPVQPDVLFYVSNAVWKSTDHAHSWTRISPDLARQTWAVPASAGKYAAGVTPAPQGAITALSLSPRSLGVLWAGTDDGQIQTTSDGGVTWRNVTPPAIKPWTRIFNLDAGHFDALTAYAAANTLRIDDLNPHFWRTHDGGKTWTEINTGIASGAASNSIREDPRKPGLLYAATDTQVWVSFDDGDHWQSLRLDMPAVSVRDIQVKDDSTCLCADLIAGTHGRGFWILDDVTPLRQAAAAMASAKPYLFKPVTAVRVRFAGNDPTPWPPELPAGENPPPGALIDYYLPAAVTGPLELQILDAGGKLVRSFSSDDRPTGPDPALDPEGYNKLCQQTPSAPNCNLPLYWPAPPQRLSTDAGMHRFSWDLRYAPLSPDDPGAAGGAVPHRTYLLANAPWAPPGSYSVRLTAGGTSMSQPLALRLDPRVRTPAVGLAQLAALSGEMYQGAKTARAAYLDARTLVAALEKLSGDAVAAFKAQVESLAPAPRPRGGFGGFGGGGFGGGGQQPPPTLESASNALLAAAMALQRAEVTPTAAQVAACAKAREQSRAVLTRWTALRTTGLAAFNAKRKAAGQPPVGLP